MMQLTMLKAKIHRAVVTRCDLHYEGSISIDAALLQAAGILPHEQVDVLNVNTGARFTTYVIKAEAGSGEIGINGAAARLAQPGDVLIILAWAHMRGEEAADHQPRVVHVNEQNRPAAGA